MTAASTISVHLRSHDQFYDDADAPRNVYIALLGILNSQWRAIERHA